MVLFVYAVRVGVDVVDPLIAVQPEKVSVVVFIELCQRLFIPRTAMCSWLFTNAAVGLRLVSPDGTRVQPCQVEETL